MAGGLPTSVTIEIEFTTGTWTDVSAYIVGETPQGGTAGRPDEYTDAAPRTWKVNLRNDDGRFTPDNPVSPYFPNVIENKRFRVTVTRGVTAYRWFTGFVLSWEPVFSDGDSTIGEVVVSAADLMSALARKTGESAYVEQARYQARLNGSSCDTWTFGGANASEVFVNSGQPTSTGTLGTAKIIQSAAGDGSWSVGTPDKLLLDGQLNFVPRASTHQGSVLRVKPIGSIVQIEFFVSIPAETTFAAGTFATIADFTTEAAEIFSIRLISDAVLGMCISVTSPAPAYSIISDSANINDGQWRKFTIYTNGAGGLAFNINDGVNQFGYPSFDITATTRVYFGGQVGVPSKEGKQSSCWPFSLAGVDIQYSSAGVFGYYANGQVSTVSDGLRFRRVMAYAYPYVENRYYADLTCTSGSPTVTAPTPRFSTADIGAGIFSTFFDASTVITAVASPTSVTMSTNALGTSAGGMGANLGPVVIGTDADIRTVAQVSPQGQPMSEAAQVIARSIGGAFWIDPTGRPTLIRAESMRPTSPLASLDIEGDVVGDSIVLRRAADSVPTRVTISGPIGDVKVVNSAAEQSTVVGSPGVIRELQVTAGCQDELDAQILAGYYLSRSKALRVAQLSVDLVTAGTDLYAAFLSGGLRPGARLRLTGLSSTVFGASTLDVLVQGWSEAWTAGQNASVIFTFDLAPADQPVEGVFDDAEYGRMAADGVLDLAFDISSSATTLGIIPTVTGTAVLSASAGDYPLDLSVLGERMTVSAAPTTTTRTNLVTNPSFETGISGWSATPTGFSLSTTNARSTVSAYIGSASMLVTWPTTTAGNGALQWTASGLSIGTKYAFSCWCYVPAGSPRVRVADLFGTMTGFTAWDLDTTGTNDGWTRVGFTATATAATHFVGLITQDASVAGQCVFVDAALMEAVTGTQTVGAYFDGANGGTWTGTAHASTSTVTVQNVTVTRGVSPTPARAHLAGEDVDIWHAAALAS